MSIHSASHEAEQAWSPSPTGAAQTAQDGAARRVIQAAIRVIRSMDTFCHTAAVTDAHILHALGTIQP